MKGKQLGGSHGQMSEPLQQIVLGGKRMSKPYVPYGMERYRIGYEGASAIRSLTQHLKSGTDSRLLAFGSCTLTGAYQRFAQKEKVFGSHL